MKQVVSIEKDERNPDAGVAPAHADTDGRSEHAEPLNADRVWSRARRRGPKTAAGRARVGLNALTHGIASTRLVVPGESITEWETYRRVIVEALAATGAVETALAERVAAALWRLQRVTAYEEAAIAERQHVATVSARLLPHPVDLDKIIRYEAHLSRQLYHALHELEAMRAARRGQPAPLVRVDLHHQLDTVATPGGAV